MQPTRRPLVQFINRAVNQPRYSSTAGNSVAKDFEEIEIPVPWGHVAGKWYGPKHVRPLVGLHGWQDNAGTFDRLAPLLPKHISFLSLDMPGHGRSSWVPEGNTYHIIDYVTLLLRIMHAYKWDKISIFGHSMGALNGYVFNALFPDKVDMFIGLDDIKPPERSAKDVVDMIATLLGATIKMEQQTFSSTVPPCYDWDQLVERMCAGYKKEVDKEVCKHLLERNVKPSDQDPNKYYFSRDARIKIGLTYTLPHKVAIEMARRITCPHLFIKANEGHLWESQKNFDETVEVLRQNKLFEYHRVPGTHFVHLNNPERIANIVCDFINIYRPQQAEEKKVKKVQKL